VNRKLRESRLFRGTASYVTRSLGTMLRVYLLYQPLQFFVLLSGLSLAAALVLFARFLVIFWLQPVQSGHVQSLIVAGALAVIGVLFLALGVLSDLIAMNRRLLEEIVVNTRLARLDRGRRDDPPPGAGE
jgi:hypothetical protein